MSKPSRSHTGAILAFGAVFDASSFFFAAKVSAMGAAVIGASVGLACIASLYAVTRRAWHRAAGWYGPEAEYDQWARGGMDPAVVGRWSALGGVSSGVVMLLAAIFGVSEGQLLAFLGAWLGTIFLSLGSLWFYLLSPNRAQPSNPTPNPSVKGTSRKRAAPYVER